MMLAQEPKQTKYINRVIPSMGAGNSFLDDRTNFRFKGHYAFGEPVRCGGSQTIALRGFPRQPRGSSPAVRGDCRRVVATGVVSPISKCPGFWIMVSV